MSIRPRSRVVEPVETQPQMKLSIFRLLIVIAVIGGFGALVTRWAMTRVADARTSNAETWVAPYVDVTLTPTFHFEDPAEQPARDAVLGFIVADPSEPCTPSWGAYYSLDAASRALDLDRRIVRLRERGGDAIISFGGAINQELAVACTDPAQLMAAYKSVINRYGIDAIDFDIEGADMANTEANQRRAAAIVQLQKEMPDLEVWLTLPVDPHGLPAAALGVVESAYAAGANIAGVNVMTMNYGGSIGTLSMRDATKSALLATHQQINGLFVSMGTPLTEHEIWGKIGATPMIGQNDDGATFSTGDARAMLSFAEDVEIGRLSFWSANRDVSCGAVVDDQRVSNTCSGVDQDPLEFGRIFAESETGRRDDLSEEEKAEDLAERTGSVARDEARTSPYPIWRAAKAYTEGGKVVWQGRVYEAKWWTEGDQPDAPIKHVWETPWRYLGPVLDLDAEAIAAASKPVADGAYPRWTGEGVYVKGDIIEYKDEVFRAKWWTQGVTPTEDPDQPYDHPWEYLGIAERVVAGTSPTPAMAAPTSTPQATPTRSATVVPLLSPVATPAPQ